MLKKKQEKKKLIKQKRKNKMDKTPIYNQQGKKTGEINLNPTLFNVEIKQQLVQKVAVAQMANKRKVLAHTKDRSEVSGGGAKPWRQKGTGRARHGSIRSPIWVGGGVTFGPNKYQNFKQKINKKTKKIVLSMILSDRAKEAKIIILESLQLVDNKTKELFMILKKLPLKQKSSLLIMPKSEDAVKKAARNIPRFIFTTADQLNILDLLNSEYLIFLKDSLKRLEEVYLKNNLK